MEEILSRHRKEVKHLQGVIQGLKRSVAKSDKKRRKEVALEINKLETELKNKHESELREWGLQSADVSIEAEPLEEPNASLLERLSLSDDRDGEKKVTKMSKAQRKREKKLQEQRERDERIALEESQAQISVRQIEAEQMSSLLTQRGLCVYEIPSDGDCLYKAVEHQLSIRNISFSVKELRTKIADLLIEHKNEYLPFLTNDQNDLMTDLQYEKYCDDIKNTKAWGGHLELKALSSILMMPIEVCQATGPSIMIGEEYQSPPLMLSYHRHAFHLGEHYNSVVKKDVSSDK